MNRKEERLSPQAKKLLEGARQRAINPSEARKYLQSVSPEKLNLYDRQKIGREILIRGKKIANKEEIKKDYGLAYKDDSASREQVISQLLEGGRCLKKENYRCATIDFANAIDMAKGAGFYDLAIKAYSSMLKVNRKSGVYDVDELKVYEQEINQLKERITPSSGLERISATSAIIGLVGGSFFLSSNVTGNVIGLSNTTSSWIGGILILIGLIALGFWVKNRKNNKKVFVSKKKK